MALTLQQQLDDAQAQYHELVVGRAPRVVVDANGERVEFTAANQQKLYLYIQSLQAQIAALTPIDTVQPANGPVRFIF